MKTSKYLLILCVLLIVLVEVPYATSSSALIITVQTDKPSYYIEESINVFGQVMLDSVPVQGKLVALEVHNPANSTIIARTLETNATGIYSTNFMLTSEALLGTYTIYVSCTQNETKATNTTSFKLEQKPDLKVAVKTSRNSYRTEENIYIEGNTTFQNNPLQGALVALEVQDPAGTPVVIRVLQTGTDGRYQLTFQMPALSKVGTYTVHASTSHEGLKATATTAFQLQAGVLTTDVNGDGKVNIIDIALVALAFGSYPGHPRWNPKCDINGDERINIIDIAMVAKDFGKIS